MYMHMLRDISDKEADLLSNVPSLFIQVRVDCCLLWVGGRAGIDRVLLRSS